jgi:hypothetical protein
MLAPIAVVVCALGLLGRSSDSTVQIRFLNTPPPGVSRYAEGLLARNPPAIYLILSSRVFRDAQAVERCNESEPFRKLASIIAHEEWHLRNGPDEQGAYLQQLTILGALGANSATTSGVRKSMMAVVKEQKRMREPDIVIAGGRR